MVGGTDSAAALACGWIGLAQDNHALFSKLSLYLLERSMWHDDVCVYRECIQNVYHFSSHDEREAWPEGGAE